MDYNSVLAVEPQNLDALIGLAHVARAHGDLDKSLQLFSAAASAHPDVVWPRAELGLLLRELGKQEEAQRYFRSCLADPGCAPELRPDLLVTLGTILVDRGERSEAIGCFAEAV